MNSAVASILLIGFFAVFIGFIGWLGARQSKLEAENVRRLADSLGLEYFGKPPVMGLFYTDMRAAGEIRGRRVEVFSFTTGAGKSRLRWAAVSVALASGAPGISFSLRQQGFGTKVMELFGAREIQVGDAEFDRGWFIQAKPAEIFQTALLPEVRDKIMALMTVPDVPARNLEFKLENGTVQYAEVGRFEGAVYQRCLRTPEIVCDLADAIEAAADVKR